MNPEGTLSVEECATGIVKVAFDANTENGEFYQVLLPRKARLTN